VLKKKKLVIGLAPKAKCSRRHIALEKLKVAVWAALDIETDKNSNV
jgi:hypothetical protein